MKKLFMVALLTVIGVIANTGNHKAYALSYTDIQGTTSDAVALISYPIQTAPLSGTISVDPIYYVSTDTTSITMSTNTDPALYSSTIKLLPSGTDYTTTTSNTDAILVVNAYPATAIITSIMPTYNLGDILSVGTYQYSPLSLSNAVSAITYTQPVSAQNTTSTTTITQPSYYYVPPQLVSSSPAEGSGISGSAYKFNASISDPNNLVRTIRFTVYDFDRNMLFDTESSINAEGKWVADKSFDSTQYADGYRYFADLTTEAKPSTTYPDRQMLTRNSVYFGIDNIKSLEVSTFPDTLGNTTINQDFVASSYTSHGTGDITIAATNVQFYYLDSQGNRIPQGAVQPMSKDSSPYSSWNTPSMISKTFFTKGNGKYLAVFTSTYEDGATTITEAPFEVYISNDVTPPAKPKLVSPTNGITMLPGNITYKWSGNEGDDITGYNFERGEIDPISGIFEGRAGGPGYLRDGSFSWTEYSIIPLEATVVNWRIQVRDRAGNWSPWSNASTYTIDPHYVPDTTPPSKPTLLSPLNNQNVNGSKVIQSWRNDANDIDYYTYESYKDPQRKNRVSQDKISLSTRITLNQPNGALWWRIQAVDKSGNKSEWSDLFKMTISNVTIKK